MAIGPKIEKISFRDPLIPKNPPSIILYVCRGQNRLISRYPQKLDPYFGAKTFLYMGHLCN